MRPTGVLLLLLSGLLAAQKAAPPARAGAKVPELPPVLVDVVATDQANVPIHGLTGADFRLYEDGKEQAITAFRTQAGPANADSLPPSRIVLLVAPQSPDSQQWIQHAARKFVADNAAANRPVMFVFTDVCNGTRFAPFSSDAGQLQQTLDNWPDLLHCAQPADPGTYAAPAYYAQVADTLAAIPGHKTVVLFVATAGQLAGEAANKPLEAAPSKDRDRGRAPSGEPHRDPFDMEHEFRRADASVYSVETQAGMALPSWATYLAANTGGRSLNRDPDGDGALDQITRERNESYTLAFTPRISAEGSCHELKISVNRPDTKVLGRNLYCYVPEAPVTAAAKPAKEKELDTLARSANEGDTAATASIPYFYEPDGVARVNLALDIPTPVLEATDKNGKLHAEMDLLGVAYVPGGSVAARFTHKMNFDFDTRQQFEDFLRHPLHCEHQFEVAPGKYQFKVVFRSAADRFGSVEAPLDIDPFNPAQLRLSALALSSKVQAISPEAAQDEIDAGNVPLIFRGNRITVSGSDVLAKTSTAEAYFEIYEPPAATGAAVQLTMRLRVLDASGTQERWKSGDIDLSALAKTGNRVIPVALKLPLASLPAGTYRAEVTVTDSAAGSATRTIDFRAE